MVKITKLKSNQYEASDSPVECEECEITDDMLSLFEGQWLCDECIRFREEEMLVEFPSTNHDESDNMLFGVWY